MGAKIFLRGLRQLWLRACGLLYISKNKHFLAYFIRFSKIRSCKPGYAPASPAAHLQCSTARIWRDPSAAWLCSCKLVWRSDECVLLPCFNAQPDIFAVMNCCVVALSLFSSDSLTWSAENLYSVQWNKGSGCRKIWILCRQTSPKRWFRNMEMLSNCDVTNSAHQIQMTTIWPWTKPPWKFSAYATGLGLETCLETRVLKPRSRRSQVSSRSRRISVSISRLCVGYFLWSFARSTLKNAFKKWLFKI